jgi:hypothetical protein
LKLYFWTALSTMSVINFFSLLNSLISAAYDFVNSNLCTEVKYSWFKGGAKSRVLTCSKISVHYNSNIHRNVTVHVFKAVLYYDNYIIRCLKLFIKTWLYYSLVLWFVAAVWFGNHNHEKYAVKLSHLFVLMVYKIFSYLKNRKQFRNINFNKVCSFYHLFHINMFIMAIVQA